jgi:hypothetical protein
MYSPQVLTKVCLAVAFACTIAVIILFKSTSAGFTARLLVYAFLIGLLTSGIAAVLSLRSGSQKVLQRTCSGTFGAYALTSCAAVIWVVLSKPPFG